MRASVFSQGRGRASFREAKRSVCAACRADGAFRRRRAAQTARSAAGGTRHAPAATADEGATKAFCEAKWRELLQEAVACFWRS